jgi:hypothetical protein
MLFGSEFATIVWTAGIMAMALGLYIGLLLLPYSSGPERRSLARLSAETHRKPDGTRVMFLGQDCEGHEFWAVLAPRWRGWSWAAVAGIHMLLVLDHRNSADTVWVHAMPRYMDRAVIVNGFIAPPGGLKATDDLRLSVIGVELGQFPAGADVSSQLYRLLLKQLRPFFGAG